ncbi:MAG TPA: hypothetical protein VE152_10970, partial [Acidimicrobiales bacterium]|nr:hypothetical protein [Acidimicrobiales bacterium]
GGPLAVETLGPGEVVGLSWLLPPYRWQWDARAIEPVGAVAVDAACLRATCDRDPRLGYELMKRFALVMEARLHRARLKGLDLYAHDAVG